VNDKRPVRIGVIGTGDFGVRHVAIAAALPEVELVAVADTDAARAQAVGSRYGASAHTGGANLLGNADVDAVVIATPERHHLGVLETALDARVDVLIEKPLVARVSEVERVRTMVEASPQIVLPGHVSRFLPAFAALRERLHGQRVLAVRAIRVVPRGRLDLHGKEHPALVAMVHDLDLIHALIPAALLEVRSVQRWSEPARPHPQVVMAHLTFADGTLASVENYWTLPHERQYIDARLEVTTATEVLTMTTPGGSLRVTAAEGDHSPDTELDAWVAGIPTGALATQMRHFVECVRSRRRSDVVSVEDGLWSVAVASELAGQAEARRQ
jgi:predicted dehydrogenase